MQIIMGGSGSTGSSLLKNILGRNPDIFAGGETEFFAKRLIYTDWKKARKRIFKRGMNGLRNYSWHIYNGTDLDQEEYMWTYQDLVIMTPKAESLQAFCKQYFGLPMSLKGANHWLEKTPSNAACFRYFLDSFPDGKVIHITRNPYDTIGSLCSRGIDLYYAVGIYLLNTACGESMSSNPRVYTVKYEDLTQEPESTVRAICTFLGVKYEADMLLPQGEFRKEAQIKGWKYDQTDEVKSGAVGRFNNLPENEQTAILEAVSMMHINAVGQKYYGVDYKNIEELCDSLGYEYYPIGKRASYQKMRVARKSDRWNRIRRGYASGIYYPIEIKK